MGAFKPQRTRRFFNGRRSPRHGLSNRVLIVSDDPQLRRFVTIGLGANGYEVIEIETIDDGVRALRSVAPDLVLTGVDECDALVREMKAATKVLGSIPVILLSDESSAARGAEIMELPANASIARPFAIGELLAQVRAALGERRDVEQDGVVLAGDVRMDFVRRVITKGGREVHLSRREYDLLQCLASNPDHVVGQRQILKAVWGPGHVQDTQYLRVYIQQLRQKLEDDPAAPRLLVTELGIGYRLRTGE